ncbi:MAG: BlaI/MecI/CopY family transcriptional regulator [Verrucomicrobiales bacterium]
MVRKRSGNKRAPDPLSRRERQVMDIIYAAGKASAREVMEKIPDAPSNATVRSILRVLVEKGELSYEKQGRSFIYTPCQSRAKVARTALSRLLQTFYGGSVGQAVSGLLELESSDIDAAELERIEELIATHKTKQQKESK